MTSGLNRLEKIVKRSISLLLTTVCFSSVVHLQAADDHHSTGTNRVTLHATGLVVSSKVASDQATLSIATVEGLAEVHETTHPVLVSGLQFSVICTLTSIKRSDRSSGLETLCSLKDKFSNEIVVELQREATMGSDGHGFSKFYGVSGGKYAGINGSCEFDAQYMKNEDDLFVGVVMTCNLEDA